MSSARFIGRSLHDAIRAFRDHYNQLLATTLTAKPLIATSLDRRGTRFLVGFRDAGHQSVALLRTDFGIVGLYVDFRFEAAVASSRTIRLQVTSYKLALSDDWHGRLRESARASAPWDLL